MSDISSTNTTTKKPIIYKPGPQFGHRGDTFREIIDVWASRGLVNIKESPDRFVWWGEEPGEILLHDHPRIEYLPNYRLGLFGNMQGLSETKDKPWIFWPRNPVKLETTREKMKFDIPPDMRYIQSSFVGKVENQLQADNRFQTRINWFEHIHLFQVVSGVQSPYPFDHNGYLHVLSRTKFALLLPGYGPKCNRDIEAVAMGAVPVVTPGVDTTYYDSWVEGENYLRMNTVEDLQKIFNETSREKLREIQKKNFDWWYRNCSLVGSFHTTQRIIQENS